MSLRNRQMGQIEDGGTKRMDRSVDRDRQADGGVNKQMGQTDRQTEIQMDDGVVDRQTDSRRCRQTMEGQTDGDRERREEQMEKKSDWKCSTVSMLRISTCIISLWKCDYVAIVTACLLVYVNNYLFICCSAFSLSG